LQKFTYESCVIKMFALPAATWIIITAVLGFWIVYTGVFYAISKNWAVEDVDYDNTKETL